jgi:hypothetical protein
MKMHETRKGVMVAESVSELPDCFDWQQVGCSNDYENQYGHIVEVREPNEHSMEMVQTVSD